MLAVNPLGISSWATASAAWHAWYRRRGAALVRRESPCAACGHSFSKHETQGTFHECEACEVPACRAFAPGLECPEASGAQDAVERILRSEVALYAVASILYYRHSISLVSDLEYDTCCQRLLAWRAWEQYEWLEEAALRAGTGYDLARIPEDYWREAAKRL